MIIFVTMWFIIGFCTGIGDLHNDVVKAKGEYRFTIATISELVMFTALGMVPPFIMTVHVGKEYFFKK